MFYAEFPIFPVLPSVAMLIVVMLIGFMLNVVMIIVVKMLSVLMLSGAVNSAFILSVVAPLMAYILFKWKERLGRKRLTVTMLEPLI